MHVPADKWCKLDAKAALVTFVGYKPGSKGYQLWDKNTCSIHLSRDVTFNESSFPARDKETSPAPMSQTIIPFYPVYTVPNMPAVPQMQALSPSLTSAKINFSYSILFHLTTSYSSYFGGKKGISRNKTSFFLLMWVSVVSTRACLQSSSHHARPRGEGADFGVKTVSDEAARSRRRQAAASWREAASMMVGRGREQKWAAYASRSMGSIFQPIGGGKGEGAEVVGMLRRRPT